MLADRLMSKTDYDTDRDLHTLELLKLRFGESNLHQCEIMLKARCPPTGRTIIDSIFIDSFFIDNNQLSQAPKFRRLRCF